MKRETGIVFPVKTTIKATHRNGQLILSQPLLLPHDSQVRLTVESDDAEGEAHPKLSDGLTPPESGKRLFAEVFKGRFPQAIVESVADGITAVIGNVERVLDDVHYLRQDGRFAAASFFLATADEEVAKVLILIDACRLDPDKHVSVLQSLCKAFYDHRLKYAYNAMRRYPPVFNGMVAGWRFWTKRWWPGSSDPEDGEPALPHDTYFGREMPLYVDWDYYSKKWVLPDNSMNAGKFGNDPAPNPLDRLCGELRGLKAATEAKLLCAEALLCVNEVWSDLYVNETTPTAVIEETERRLVGHLAAKFGVSEEQIGRFPLLERPLYHFTTLREG